MTVGYLIVDSALHPNIRYAELLPRLDARGTTVRLAGPASLVRLYRRLARHGAFRNRVAQRVMRRVRASCDVLLAADTTIFSWHQQMLHFAGPVIVDLDDPEFTPSEIKGLSHDRVLAIVTTTETLRERLISHGVTKPVHVIPQVVSDAWLRLGSSRVAPNGTSVIGVTQPFVCLDEGDGSRITNYSVQLLVDAVATLQRANVSCVLEIIGRPSPALEAYARTAPWIRLRGYLAHDDLAAAMQRWTVACYPRRRDHGGRFSIKLLEYMALGLPIVASANGETRMVRTANAGVIAEQDAEWATVLAELLSNRNTREKYSLAGRSYAAAFAASGIAHAYSELLRDICTQATAGAS